MPQRKIVSTPRLILRTTCEDDIRALHDRIFADADVIRFVFSDGGSRSTSRRNSSVSSSFNFTGDSLGLSSLLERQSGEVIGFSGLEPCDVLGSRDLGLGFVLARYACA
ncbi:MAG: GNAT family N-acetyltransferase [Betaproteobacteria bacterium]